MKTVKHPLMYKGYIIKKVIGPDGKTRLSGYSFKTDYFINPLYETWEQLKLVIDALKE